MKEGQKHLQRKRVQRNKLQRKGYQRKELEGRTGKVIAKEGEKEPRKGIGRKNRGKSLRRKGEHCRIGKTPRRMRETEERENKAERTAY